MILAFPVGNSINKIIHQELINQDEQPQEQMSDVLVLCTQEDDYRILESPSQSQDVRSFLRLKISEWIIILRLQRLKSKLQMLQL